MRDRKPKISIALRDVLTLLILVLGTTAIIVWSLPREGNHYQKIEQGRPWHYGTLTAPFDFPVYKSEATIKAERDSALKEYEPYYSYQKEVGGQQVRKFANDFKEGIPGLSKDYISIIANRLHRLYLQGIMNSTEFSELSKDTLCTIRIVNGKTAVSTVITKVCSPVIAYEQLLEDPVLKSHQEQLRQCNLNSYIVPNLIFDKQRSEASKADLTNSIPLASGVVQRGQKIIDRGDIVDEQTKNILTSLFRELDRRHHDNRQLSVTILGESAFVLILMVCFTLYLLLFRDDYFDKTRSMIMPYTLIVIFAVLAALMVGHTILHIFIVPFAVVPIIIRIFMDSRTAFVTHTVLVLLCAALLQRPFEFIVVEMVAGMTAIYSLRELSSRSQLFWTAAAVTAASMATNLALDWMNSSQLNAIDSSEYNFLLVNGILLFCTYPLLYIIEKLFGFTSDITLIELSDMNKKLLRLMSEVAPGTFQHSIQVGNLAAEIARKIGGNAQLVRTGALYHDIGKTQNPIYFTENQSGFNPHETLTCIESASMIISHVTEGVKLADKYGLPQVIKEFIQTHHGQGKTKYFYVKYKNEHPDEPVDELLFTYPGPNPFTKEQAVLMMADTVEAASRSLADYSEKSIKELVNRLIDSQVADGYFRECPITFRDIEYAKTVLIEKLKTIHHTRLNYPELKQ